MAAEGEPWYEHSSPDKHPLLVEYGGIYVCKLCSTHIIPGQQEKFNHLYPVMQSGGKEMTGASVHYSANLRRTLSADCIST